MSERESGRATDRKRERERERKADLLKDVLALCSVDYEKDFYGLVGHLLIKHAFDLFQLLHEVHVCVQAPYREKKN